MNLKVGTWRDVGQPVLLPDKVHRNPIYMLGISGSGKSTALGQMALQWSQMGEGVLVIDVKDGQLARNVITRADPANTILVAPGLCYFENHPHHWGLNILEMPNRYRETVSQVVDNVLSMLERLDRADYAQMVQLRTNLDCAVRLSLYEDEPNLRMVRRALTDQTYRKTLIARHGHHLNEEVHDHFIRLDDPKANSAYGRNQNIASTVNRLKELLTPEELAMMLTQPRTSMRLGEWLEAGKLVVVDCASGMSNRNAELLGNLVLTQMMHFTFMRKVAEDDPWEGTTRPIRLICDEFDLLAGNNFSRLITKARSYRVFPVMSHQNLDQLRHNRDAAQTLYNAVSGVPVVFAFPLTDQDRQTMRQTRKTEVEATEAFTAVLSLKSVSLPYGLLDAGDAALISLPKWKAPGDESLFDSAVEAQRPLVVPERTMREKMKAYAAQQIIHPAGAESTQTAQQSSPRTRTRPTGRGVHAGVESVPEADSDAALAAALLPPEAH